MLTYIVFETSVCDAEREYRVIKELLPHFLVIYQPRKSVVHLQTPRGELKIRHAEESFWLPFKCLEMCLDTVFRV